jgi:hypothetical protein
VQRGLKAVLQGPLDGPEGRLHLPGARSLAQQRIGLPGEEGWLPHGIAQGGVG